jgi:hypothetical protein
VSKSNKLLFLAQCLFCTVIAGCSSRDCYSVRSQALAAGGLREEAARIRYGLVQAHVPQESRGPWLSRADSLDAIAELIAPSQSDSQWYEVRCGSVVPSVVPNAR